MNKSHEQPSILSTDASGKLIFLEPSFPSQKGILFAVMQLRWNPSADSTVSFPASVCGISLKGISLNVRKYLYNS